VGWIGTGVMGKNMCKHVMNKGFNMQVYNRTASKADELVAAGAEFKNPVEIAKEVDVLVLMLGYPTDVEEMCLNAEHGIV